MDVLEQGPWMVQNIPIILNKWSPDISLTKGDLTRVPVWVKLHDIPLVGYTNDGLSLIASKVGKPMMSDSFTSSICVEAWGRPNFARALIEVSVESDLKDEIKVATPSLDGHGRTTDLVHVEYEWKPPWCSCCKVYGHIDTQCPKVQPKVLEVEIKQKQVDADGFQEVIK
ncbi:uncharacterized protein [Rutidosis leptorrhynchoides]|uniref:uncharacterized protein n=1 Tax=Rutidosis leptorrhynchoides TaxID=125765 RepID=UPI003A99405B